VNIRIVIDDQNADIHRRVANVLKNPPNSRSIPGQVSADDLRGTLAKKSAEGAAQQRRTKSDTVS
jgi:hypothetical protein